MTDSPLRSGLDTPKSSDLDNVSLRAFELLCTRRAQVRSFDPDRRINDDVLARVLRATQRAPTAFNLQPWNAIIVQDPRRRASLCEAALGQRVVSEAPVTIVFAGDTQPCRNASKARALGAQTGYYPAHYEPLYMRYVLYMLHGGPCGVMQPVKAMTSWVYASLTGTPMLTVPPSLRAYAWKQTMLPVGYLLLAATAAGLGTAVLEGIDEERVKAVVELPASYTVPCLVALGYEKLLSPDARVPSPRFDPKEVFSRDVFGTPINIFDLDGKHDK